MKNVLIVEDYSELQSAYRRSFRWVEWVNLLQAETIEDLDRILSDDSLVLDVIALDRQIIWWVTDSYIPIFRQRFEEVILLATSFNGFQLQKELWCNVVVEWKDLVPEKIFEALETLW